MGRVQRTPRDSVIIEEITSKNLREFHRWMVSVSEKLEGTDTTLADEEKKSISPIIGMVQNVERKIETLSRDNRNLSAKIEALQRVEHENRTLRSAIAALTKRLERIEGEL